MKWQKLKELTLEQDQRGILERLEVKEEEELNINKLHFNNLIFIKYK